MIQRKKKIVLFLPHRADPGRGETFSADLLPLELLFCPFGVLRPCFF